MQDYYIGPNKLPFGRPPSGSPAQSAVQQSQVVPFAVLLPRARLIAVQTSWNLVKLLSSSFCIKSSLSSLLEFANLLPKHPSWLSTTCSPTQVAVHLLRCRQLLSTTSRRFLWLFPSTEGGKSLQQFSSLVLSQPNSTRISPIVLSYDSNLPLDGRNLFFDGGSKCENNSKHVFLHGLIYLRINVEERAFGGEEIEESSKISRAPTPPPVNSHGLPPTIAGPPPSHQPTSELSQITT
ncbi:hypothetical protein M5K25_012191 [Dendrobium thyrsiflorum]|uniref:Uncharacterized protein n=1 Tax=Dendrobium thyrsiflorum TaxID=117978 RepID=A0ABD0UWZ7_DENTH